MNDWDEVRVFREHRSSMKLRIAAVALALGGSVSAVWLALEGQSVRLQQAIFAERQVRSETLAAEIGQLDIRLKLRSGEVATVEGNLLQMRRQLADADAAFAKAANERDKAEAARAAAVDHRGAVLATAEKEQQTIEQLKTQTAAARVAHGIAQAETAVVTRELNQLKTAYTAAEGDNSKLREERNDLLKAVAVLKPELQALRQQKAAATAEIDRSEKRIEALRTETQREQDRIAQLRLEAPDLKLEAERLRRQAIESRKDIEELNRQRPALLAQVQTLQKQTEHLQNGVRHRSEFIEQSEKRLSENVAKVAEADARRATYEARAKELQDQLRDHTKRSADDKREADRIASEISRLQEQSRALEPQRREVVRVTALREQGERQLGEVESRLSARRQELLRIEEAIKARAEEQRQKISAAPIEGGHKSGHAKVEAAASDDLKLNPKR
jgi:chromosome segregation ATPase